MLTSDLEKVTFDASGKDVGDAKYANHHCEENCEFVSEVYTDKNGELVEAIFIKAKRTLYMFEEVTVKYD